MKSFPKYKLAIGSLVLLSFAPQSMAGQLATATKKTKPATPQRITFKRGSVSQTVSGNFKKASDEKLYVIGVQDGQKLTVSGSVSLYITGPDGEEVSDVGLGCNSNQSVDPTSAGDYTITAYPCRKNDKPLGKYKILFTAT